MGVTRKGLYYILVSDWDTMQRIPRGPFKRTEAGIPLRSIIKLKNMGALKRVYDPRSVTWIPTKELLELIDQIRAEKNGHDSV